MNDITGDSSKVEDRALKVRTTINLAPEIKDMAVERAAADRRSVSNYIECLIQQDMQLHGKRAVQLAPKPWLPDGEPQQLPLVVVRGANGS